MKPTRRNLLFAAGALALAPSLAACGRRTIELHGAGATFPAPLYARWMALFHRQHPEIRLRYTPVGSSAGIAAITDRSHDFAGSDALPTDGQLKRMPGEALVLPMALGPVVLAYNLPGFKGGLTLSGEVVAGIYLGRITRWRDPAILALNPGAEIPDLPIRPAMRSDGSGTSSIFTTYLSAVSGTWAREVGAGTRVVWPTGTEWSGQGNDGVAQRILLLPGGLGYLEMRYAQNSGLSFASLVNRAGAAVTASVESVQKAEASTPALPGSHLKPSIVDAPGPDAYPIAGFTYVLIYRDLTYLEDRAEALVRYLRWCLNEGQLHAPALHYTPLPGEARRAALALLGTVHLPVTS